MLSHKIVLIPILSSGLANALSGQVYDRNPTKEHLLGNSVDGNESWGAVEKKEEGAMVDAAQKHKKNGDVAMKKAIEEASNAFDKPEADAVRRELGHHGVTEPGAQEQILGELKKADDAGVEEITKGAAAAANEGTGDVDKDKKIEDAIKIAHENGIKEEVKVVQEGIKAKL